jgi:hypothetical protein
VRWHADLSVALVSLAKKRCYRLASPFVAKVGGGINCCAGSFRCRSGRHEDREKGYTRRKILRIGQLDVQRGGKQIVCTRCDRGKGTIFSAENRLAGDRVNDRPSADHYLHTPVSGRAIRSSDRRSTIDTLDCSSRRDSSPRDRLPTSDVVKLAEAEVRVVELLVVTASATVLVP